jgi:protoporphyrin/coproporphyrin ferrochelatase
MQAPPDHPQIPPRRIGVLLVNLGSPEAPTRGAVKRYLREFLSDRRVVELHPAIWQPILRGVVLNTRPRQSAHAYSTVWADEGAPLVVITAQQAAALADALGPAVLVDWAMRYGSPSIPDRLRAMKDGGCERVLIAPMYPQYSAATTATVNDRAFATLATMRWQPAIRTLPPFHDDAAYIEALRASVERQLAALPFEPEAVVASFHSMPLRTLLKGDPYHCHCMKTARLLSEALGRELTVSFQSKLGRAKWLEPSTEDTLARLGREGVRRLAVVTPGFVADNLETLEEIAIRGRETFEGAGGEQFAALECLNASVEGVTLLKQVVGRELAGWLDPSRLT